METRELHFMKGHISEELTVTQKLKTINLPLEN